MQPPPIAPILAASTSAPPVVGDLKPGWTEHNAPDGRKYYYHSETKQSSWEKPAIDKAPEASIPWKEHTAPDGRKYYYNKETKVSSWTMPEELKKLQGVSAKEPSPATSKPAAGAGGKDKAEPLSKQDSVGEEFIYATKAEAKDAFKQLLASCGCTSDWSWEHAMKQIQGKARYDALKSMGEKKQCFNEYVNQRRNEEKEEERRRIRQAREDFVSMLIGSRQVRAAHGFKRARDVLEEDPRWKVRGTLISCQLLFNAPPPEPDPDPDSDPDPDPDPCCVRRYLSAIGKSCSTTPRRRRSSEKRRRGR